MLPAIASVSRGWSQRRGFVIGCALVLSVVIGAGLRFDNIDAPPVFMDEDSYTLATLDMMRLPTRDALAQFPDKWEPIVLKAPWLFLLRGRIARVGHLD